MIPQLAENATPLTNDNGRFYHIIAIDSYWLQNEFLYSLLLTLVTIQGRTKLEKTLHLKEIYKSIIGNVGHKVLNK